MAWTEEQKRAFAQAGGATGNAATAAERAGVNAGGYGGTGGAGYNPSNDVNSEIYNINTGGYRNNPNQSFIDFGNSGVLGKQDWIKQNPNMGGYGMPTEAVDSAYNAYVSDYAKQNGFENLDVSDWENKRDKANAWNEERSKMSDEEQLYSYLQGLVDEGKISRDDATYISRNIYGQDAAGNQIDYAGGWASYSDRKNRGGFTDLYDAYDQADAIMAAFNNGEFKNPNDLYAALDEWTSHHDEDMVTAMIQILDDEFAEAGWNVNLYDNYLPHWYDDVEVVLDGQEATPANQATSVNQRDALVSDLDGYKETLETSTGIIRDMMRDVAEELLASGNYPSVSIDMLGDDFDVHDPLKNINDPRFRAAFDQRIDTLQAQNGEFKTVWDTMTEDETNVGTTEKKILSYDNELKNEETLNNIDLNNSTSETVANDLRSLEQRNSALYQRIVNEFIAYLEESEPEKAALFTNGLNRNEFTGDFEVPVNDLAKNVDFMAWFDNRDNPVWASYNLRGNT